MTERKRFFDMAKERSEQDAWKFLMKRGLTRDRANYVTTLVRMRQDLESLRKLVKDAVVLDCIHSMVEIVSDEVSDLYELQAMDDNEHKRK